MTINTAIELKDGVARDRDTGALLGSVYVANTLTGSGPPSSGTTGTGAVSYPEERVTFYVDNDSGVVFVNEGTGASPYWTPAGLDQFGLWGAFEDGRSQVGEPVADTDAELILNSGVRIFGQGIAETDSGVVVQTAGEGGNVVRLTTTDEVAHTIAIGGEAGIMQPDQHGLLVVEAEVTNVSAITLRGMGIGFVGAAADAFDPPITCATTVATLVLDDLALLHFNVGYTDGDRWYVAHNKSDAAASMTVVDTSTDVAAAATYQRLRVEINEGGDMRVFIDKTQVALVADALDADEEVSPVLYLESTSTAVKSADVRRYAHWALRP